MLVRNASMLLADAAQHHGLVCREFARARGVDDADLRSLVRRGVLVRESRRVLRVRGAPQTWRQRVLIAVWSAGPGAVASGATAAALHAFDGFRSAAIRDDAPVHVLMPAGSQSFRRVGVMVHRTNQFLPADRCVVDGIPAATPIRTWLSLCAATKPWRTDRIEEALDGAERDGLVRRTLLVRRLERWRVQGRNGVRVAATLLLRRERVGGLPRSVLERRLVRLLQRCGVAVPECQVRVRRVDGRYAYLDAAWKSLRYGVEADGNVAHATPRQRAADARRSNALLADDWVVSRFTYEQVVAEPEYVAATIKRTIRARAMQFGLDPRQFGC